MPNVQNKKDETFFQKEELDVCTGRLIIDKVLEVNGENPGLAAALLALAS